MKIIKQSCWILALVAKPLMKLSIAGCKDHFRYTLLSEDSDMIKLHPFQLSVNITSTAFLIIILFIVDKVIQPVHRGFFCNDHSIMKPYITDQTVPTWLLAIVACIFTLLLFVGTEFFMKNKKDNICKEQIGHIYIGNIKMKPWIYRTLTQLCFAGIGSLMNSLFTGIGKKLVGRLRPHFLSVCLPNYSTFNCSDGYIIADVCTTQDKASLLQARLSFPSGHASSSAYTSILFALYIEYAIPCKKFYMVKPTLQFISISLGVSCGYTRISDYWHHWSDVLGGFLIGTAFALYTIFGLMKLHCKESVDLKRDPEPPQAVEVQPAHTYDEQVGYPNPI